MGRVRHQNRTARSADILRTTLHRIDGKGYGAYKDILGAYSCGNFDLHIDWVQSDPFAPPSPVRLHVPQREARFPEHLFATRDRRLGLEDFLTRALSGAASLLVHGERGTGRSGVINVVRCGQEMLERTAVQVTADFVEASFFVGLPSFGRRIAGKEAEEMFFTELPRLVRDALIYGNLRPDEIALHGELAEDAEALRAQLRDNKLVAFVADDAVLPRESGVSDRPLVEQAIPFKTPESLEVHIDVPNHGRLHGLGLREGITLIVGGGCHGKSTLLNAIARGVYNHIPGDGRDLVITAPDAVKVRAEDGRSVERVDISPFISNLPFGVDTTAFSSPNASGSISQATNIIEAIEAGSRLLLIDEDTSATNFMIRDERMQALVSKKKEPITPLIDTVRRLWEELGVSTILVMGGSGDYFDVADTVIMMDTYEPHDVTAKAKRIAKKIATGRKVESSQSFQNLRQRLPLARSLEAADQRVKIRPSGLSALSIGLQRVDLGAVEQLVEEGQTRAVGWLIAYAAQNLFDGERTIREMLDALDQSLDRDGLAALMPNTAGDYVRPRRYEIAAVLNRLRTLACKS
jgi:predicted ABC-class ATPase